MTDSDSLPAQIFVSLTGVAVMTLVAYTVSWLRQQDDPPRTASTDADLVSSRS